MVVVTGHRLTIPKKVGAERSVLDRVAVATSLEPLGLRQAGSRKIRRALPVHATVASMRVVVAEANNLDRFASHSHNLGEVSDARLVTIGADQNVTDLGTIDDFLLGSHNGVHR